ncbi:MAG: hypothetical protein ACKOPM_17415 [Novosphingobium sp.]
MEWMRLLGAFALGAGVMFVGFWLKGSVNFSGDFVANVAGAAVGGAISVGLALAMFGYERRIATSDALRLANEQRAEAIRQALRHVRAIRECVRQGRELTINKSQRIRDDINEACYLTRKALEDKNLTDFPLRHAMLSASNVGDDSAARLLASLNDAKLEDANMILPEANVICETAVEKLDELIRNYTELRRAPEI